jgi:hypothetical protein
MSSPSHAEHGTQAARRCVRSATFRFSAPAPFALVRLRGQARLCRSGAERMRTLLGGAMAAVAANSDRPQPPTKNTITRDAAGKRAARPAGMGLPYSGEMEQVHDIYGGVLADGSDPGRA